MRFYWKDAAAVVLTITIVFVIMTLIFKVLQELDADNRKRELLKSQCIVEQGKDSAWCWHWANVQMGGK